CIDKVEKAIRQKSYSLFFSEYKICGVLQSFWVDKLTRIPSDKITCRVFRKENKSRNEYLWIIILGQHFWAEWPVSSEIKVETLEVDLLQVASIVTGLFPSRTIRSHKAVIRCQSTRAEQFNKRSICQWKSKP